MWQRGRMGWTWDRRTFGHSPYPQNAVLHVHPIRPFFCPTIREGLHFYCGLKLLFKGNAMYHVTCKSCGIEYDANDYPTRCGACGAKNIRVSDQTPRHEDWELESRKMEAGQPGDEPSDVDPENPVNVSAETWSDIYARHPELLD